MSVDFSDHANAVKVLWKRRVEILPGFVVSLPKETCDYSILDAADLLVQKYGYQIEWKGGDDDCAEDP